MKKTRNKINSLQRQVDYLRETINKFELEIYSLKNKPKFQKDDNVKHEDIIYSHNRVYYFEGIVLFFEVSKYINILGSCVIEYEYTVKTDNEIRKAFESNLELIK